MRLWLCTFILCTIIILLIIRSFNFLQRDCAQHYCAQRDCAQLYCARRDCAQHYWAQRDLCTALLCTTRLCIALLCTTRLCTALLCTDTIVHGRANQSVLRPKTEQATFSSFSSHNRDDLFLPHGHNKPPRPKSNNQLAWWNQGNQSVAIGATTPICHHRLVMQPPW